MRKFLFIFIFLFIFDVHASEIYISKRDKDTYDFVRDCDFILYDSFGNVVDSWVQGNDVHVLSVDEGIYSLVERPLSVGSFDSSLNKTYKLDVSSESFQVTLFNNEIDTPDNLGVNNNYWYCYFFIFLGIMLICFGKYFYA